MFLWRCLFLLLPVVTSVSTESDDTKIEYYNRLARENLARKLETFKEMHDGRLPKNIILFIGDGMGTSIVSAARMYKAEKAGKPGQYSQMPFAMEGFDSTGWSKTSSWSAHVTDSAAGAIALLRGIKGESELSGVKPGAAPDCTDESAIVGENLAELALLKNLSVGSVTTVTLTHATPAALFAKSAHRGLQDDVPKLLKKYPTCRGHDLALQLLDFPANQFTVLMGGGEKHLYPEEDDGARGDGKYVLDMWTQLPGTRKIVGNRDELMKVKANDSDLYLMGLFASEYMLPPLEATAEQKAEIPSLAEMTEKAIEILSQNENGYFLMVEGAQIDVRQHSNKLTLGADELLEFDDAIKRAREMTNREETLIIVTADHSHSLMVGEFEKKTDNMRTVGQEKKGIAFSHGTGQNRTEQDPLDLKYKFPAMIYFKRGTHGGDHVPIYSDGPYSWLFSSTIQNTEIGYLMKSLLCVTENYCLKKEGDLSPTYKKEEKPDETEDTTTTLCNVGWVSGVIITGLSFIQLSVILYWSYTNRDINN